VRGYNAIMSVFLRYGLWARRLARRVTSRLPRKRRRMWRYVSPRRRGVTLIALVTLVAMVYGYWAMTTDKRVRRHAKWYLRSLTNAHVTVGDAHFSFFGGIELYDVCAYVPDSGDPPFFRAPVVVLRHNPWAALTGRIRPTEVQFDDPELSVERDSATGKISILGLLRQARGDAKLPPGVRLPQIIVRRASLRVDEKINDLSVSPFPQVWNASLTPRGNAYVLAVEQQAGEGGRKGITGVGDLDLEKGTLEWRYLSGSIPSVVAALSNQYEKWVARYQVEGDLRLTGAIDPGATDPIELDLVNVSLRFPPAEGGLRVHQVSGQLVFYRQQDGSPERIELRDVSGRIGEAGDARFELSVMYEGMSADQPFKADLAIHGFPASELAHATGRLGEIFDNIVEQFQPDGTMDLQVGFAREEQGGEIAYQGTLRPTDLAVTYDEFPCRVTNVQGAIEFTSRGVERLSLVGRRGQGRVHIDGKVLRREGTWTYDIAVRAENIALDEGVYSALPTSYASVWEDLSPQGRASMLVRTQRTAELQPGAETVQVKHRTDVVLLLDGHCSVMYDDFPYRVFNVFGRVEIGQGRVHIDRGEPIRGRAGPMRCIIYGDVIDLRDPPVQVDLTIEAVNVPLDKTLFAALGDKQRTRLEQLSLEGIAPEVRARVIRQKGERLTYDVDATVDDVAFRLKLLPLPITSAAGEVAISPERVVMKSLQGIYDRTPVHFAGQVFLGDRLGIDMEVDASSVYLDKALATVGSSAMRKVYEQFEPNGRAAIRVSFRQNMPEQAPGDLDYRVVIRPMDLALRYVGFPYLTHAVGGKAIVTPGRVELHGILLRKNEMQGIISGTVLMDAKGEQADLRLQVRDMAIDQELLAAVPAGLAPLAGRFRPGGTCALNLSQLQYIRVAEAAGRTDGAAESDEPTTRPAHRVTWRVDGSVAIDSALVDLGLGRKVLSGKVRGLAAQLPEGLAVRAQVALDRVQIGKRELTDVRGQLVKSPASSVLHVRDLLGRCHGGRAAGFVEIRLTDPLQYGINLSVENVDLNELFNAGIEDAELRTDATGQLTGTMQLVTVADKPETRKASGVIQISRAKLYKMPVLLGMMHVVFLSLPGEAAFNEGTMSYHMTGHTLVFDEIHLTGRTMSMLGSGTMNTETEEIEFTFLTGPPGKMPRLGHLDEFVENVVRELVEIQITGTLAKPVTRTVPLRSLDAALRKLLQPRDEIE